MRHELPNRWRELNPRTKGVVAVPSQLRKPCESRLGGSPLVPLESIPAARPKGAARF
jgi:hypothetical protein